MERLQYVMSPIDRKDSLSTEYDDKHFIVHGQNLSLPQLLETVSAAVFTQVSGPPTCMKMDISSTVILLRFRIPMH